MDIRHLKAVFLFVLKNNAKAAYFMPEQFSLIGDNLKSFNKSSTSCFLSHGVYLLISKTEEQQYGFWSLSQHHYTH